jgi:CRP-like cAMP-binding protein
MKRGDFFGEQALLYNSPRTATVVAQDEVVCVALARESLTKALGLQLE